MKVMPKDDMIKLYVNIVNRIIQGMVKDVTWDSHNELPYVDLMSKKEVLEKILDVIPNNNSKSNDIKINGEDYVSET